MKKNTKHAVSLNYDGISAPRVTAYGEGALAQQIIAKAKEYGIPTEHNEELTALLSKVRLHEEIPPALYVAVAQILVFLYYVDEQQRDQVPCDESGISGI